jgi:mono/diheme cytochrome c family protein
MFGYCFAFPSDSRRRPCAPPTTLVSVSISFCMCNDLHLTEFPERLQLIQDRRVAILHEKLLPTLVAPVMTRSSLFSVTRTRIPLSLVVPLALLIPILVHDSWTQAAQTNDHLKSNANSALVNRGRYIVEDVAVCSQCHTPRNSAGDLERGQWLEGAPVWLLPARPMGDWPLQAPRIAGSPGGSDADMIRLLTTGVWRDGQRLRPPMPQFRMSREDAETVVAYLRSLTPSPR